jgi:hypothetical protein
MAVELAVSLAGSPDLVLVKAIAEGIYAAITLADGNQVSREPPD